VIEVAEVRPGDVDVDLGSLNGRISLPLAMRQADVLAVEPGLALPPALTSARSRGLLTDKGVRTATNGECAAAFWRLSWSSSW